MGKVAVVLSGSGYLDGSEIHESVLCLLHLEKQGHKYVCFAPDMSQKSVVNHLRNEVVQTETRNVLFESARIARGKVYGLKTLQVSEFDALVLPGGFGVALNLSNFSEDKENFNVHEDLEKVILEFHKNNKPIGATCISPVILAKVFQNKIKVKMTLGQDPKNLEILTKLGMEAESAEVDEVVCDKSQKVFTTPCYMEPDNLKGCSEGIEKLVKKML